MHHRKTSRKNKIVRWPKPPDERVCFKFRPKQRTVFHAYLTYLLEGSFTVTDSPGFSPDSARRKCGRNTSIHKYYQYTTEKRKKKAFL